LVVAVEVLARVLSMVGKEVSVDEGEMALVAVVARGIVSGSRSDVGWARGSSQIDFVVQVSG
jgi:hypothetical protein